ncbi:hypothetical protein C6361_31060 [Plantactinospora sp. BC1]|nr:hypothetical protein C6361_31060 [Plantactinospora sp. BC1]
MTRAGAEARTAARYSAGESGGTFGAYDIGTGSTESGHRQRRPHRQYRQRRRQSRRCRTPEPTRKSIRKSISDR